MVGRWRRWSGIRTVPRHDRLEIPRFDEFQDAVAEATRHVDARSVLELGVGTDETARRVRAFHPGASWTGIDASQTMLARAREALPDADLRLGRLEHELPEGPFDLVVSALAVHHLPPEGKRELFRRVVSVLKRGGCSRPRWSGRIATSPSSAAVVVERKDAYGEELCSSPPRCDGPLS
jgi:trans-aconitate methyltransferase